MNIFSYNHTSCIADENICQSEVKKKTAKKLLNNGDES